MFRYRTAQLQSYGGKFPDKCPFCHLDDPKLNPKPRHIIKETTHARVMDALYPYEFWEFREVTDHLMIVPKRHVSTLGELTPEERADIMDICCEYEIQNFNVYARAIKSKQRTIPLHQHTHLIRTKPQSAKRAIYFEKPFYFVKIFY